MYLNILIYRNTFKSKSYTLQMLYFLLVVMYIQKLHHFCHRSTPWWWPKVGQKVLGNKQLWKIYQLIPAEYYKINTAIWKDQQKNM